VLTVFTWFFSRRGLYIEGFPLLTYIFYVWEVERDMYNDDTWQCTGGKFVDIRCILKIS